MTLAIHACIHVLYICGVGQLRHVLWVKPVTQDTIEGSPSNDSSHFQNLGFEGGGILRGGDP